MTDSVPAAPLDRPDRTNPDLRVDGARLWASLTDMARIGATARGGSCRLALSDEDRQGRDLFVGWCRAAGCSVTVDGLGNIFARRPGRENHRPPVLIGSHLDTQPTGGRFDGVFGVLAGLEVIRTLNDLDLTTDRPLEVAVWTNEEGARFAPSMLGSGVFAGVHEADWALARTDADGVSVAEALRQTGYAGDAPVGGRPLHAVFEAHIEQGPILEAEGLVIGAVTGAQAQRWYDVTLTGVESHAGTTPMERRRDALLGAARLIDLAERTARAHGPDGRITVGVVAVHPGTRNVVPGRVFLTLDVRHPDDAEIDAIERALRDGLKGICAGIGLKGAMTPLSADAAVTFDPALVDSVRRAAAGAGYRARDMVSGAGHDACHLATFAPTAMIFVPCVDGLSHNEAEDARPEWLEAGATVLLRAVLDAARL
ncbi:Zn-dependent hydrolase [Roseospira goensis]|uniref:N-carbamoyl-L-amino-acid hydrolase n=1 Tax=Roseospira goensis TaxID=391922 RepID=A0A7W6S1B3_9PROT|nr:Zn-dependent hydrolase [Roseospira goensis]MBB4287075.1 N-carbamoyl-L-amino-acid hydrolase [Roseospira goensis]